MTRAELIAALEAAPGPSRELFVEAYRIAHNLENWQGRDPLSFARFAGLLDAEAWLEAAASLLGDEASFTLTVVFDEEGMCQGASVTRPRRWGSTEPVWHKTPAIALCIAALRAREGKDG